MSRPAWLSQQLYLFESRYAEVNGAQICDWA
jgi:hypothetical protein